MATIQAMEEGPGVLHMEKTRFWKECLSKLSRLKKSMDMKEYSKKKINLLMILFELTNTEVMQESDKENNETLASKLLDLREVILRKVKDVLEVYGVLHPELKTKEERNLARACYTANNYIKDIKRSRYIYYEECPKETE